MFASGLAATFLIAVAWLTAMAQVLGASGAPLVAAMLPAGKSDAARQFFENDFAARSEHAALARSAIVQSPLNPAAFAYLSRYVVSAPRVQAALLDHAGMLSRRSLATNANLYAREINAARPAVALPWAEAILRTGQGEEAYFLDFQRRLEDPFFGRAMAGALRRNRRTSWQPAFLAASAAAIDSKTLRALTAAYLSGEVAPPSEDLATMVEADVRGARDEAAALIIHHSAPSFTRGGLLAWTDTVGAAGGWRLPEGYHVSWSNSETLIERTGVTGAEPLRRRLALAPGGYRFTGFDPAHGRGWRVNVVCRSHDLGWRPLDEPLIITDDCPVQWVQLADFSDRPTTLAPLELAPVHLSAPR